VRRVVVGTLIAAAAVVAAMPSSAQDTLFGNEVVGAWHGFKSVLRLGDKPHDYTVQEIGIRVGGKPTVNVVHPGERPELTLHLVNQMNVVLRCTATLEVVHYVARSVPDDLWDPAVSSVGEAQSVRVELDVPAHGSQDVTVRPPIGDAYGGYAVVIEVPGHGRSFAASLVRVMDPDNGRVQFPTYQLEATWPDRMNEGVFQLFERLGVKGMRLEFPFLAGPDEGSLAGTKENFERDLNWAKQHDVTVMLTLENGNFANGPLGRPRPWLSADGVMQEGKADTPWLPAYDGDFEEWVHTICGKFGWPKGNVNAVELWNEPWESMSISGWQSDILRFREIYTHMALGVEAARAKDGTHVLIGGTDSSANTRDKLFSDGSDRFLKWMDFVSIHYQPMSADPALVPEWIHRKGPYGPVRVWDTESWIANADDRVAGVIASMRAEGQGRTAGVLGANVYTSENVALDGKTYPVVQVWSPAASIAAVQKFIGQRNFERLLFGNGLPWVLAFKGMADAPDDGTFVVLGDLKKLYEPGRTLYRSVHINPDASMVVKDPDHILRVFDFYGNAMAESEDAVRIPLNGLGYFVRTDGRAGSYERAAELLEHAKIRGIDPVEIVLHDFTRPLKSSPQVAVTLTNVLNRPIQGRLSIEMDKVRVAGGNAINLKPNQTVTVRRAVLSATADADNLYRTKVQFDAGTDGAAVHEEDLHVNLVAHRTIHVDGDLSDWEGVLPEVLPGSSMGLSLTERAYLPDRKFESRREEGAAAAYLAYDDKYFYFAAKVADTTPDDGMLRFEKRDDDSFFYPDAVKDEHGKELMWPAGVRHFTYRKNFEIPSSGGGQGHDNVQIAFNVIEKKPWLPNPPGTMPHFITYWDTNYEFALNKVAPEYGGGYEVWRLAAPGVPMKHYFPREPKAPKDSGPVHDAKLSIVYRDGERMVEAAIPWHEIPEVRARILSGKTIKFSCRINNNKGESRELATGRSVSKINTFTFHDQWQAHWSNELEFGAEPKTGH
jgi:hypothetical protein